MICIPIGCDTNAGMFALLRKAESEPADCVELRLDHLLEPPEVRGLVAASPRPVIATCRSRREGGRFDGSDAGRREILLAAARAGAAYIDSEAGDVPYLKERGQAVLIASVHDFEKTPEDLRARMDELAALPGDWVKFAVTARKSADNLAVFAAIARCPKPCVGIAMGETGLLSRVLGLAYGSMLTFGSLEAGLESAPGQPTARDLAELYRVKSLDRDTAVYGLLGNPVSQSRGYVVHNRAFAELGLNAVYIPFLVSDCAEFLDAVPAGVNLRGLSVTIPHKRAVLEWAGHLSDACRLIGAANTLVRRADGWHGDNSDYLAAFEAIRACAGTVGINLAGAGALILGAGGAARAVGTALARLGCRPAVAARDDGKASRLAAEMGWDAVPWEERSGGEWRVVANATPVGMLGSQDATPYPETGWKAGMLAFDVVHNPDVTRFLREAETKGAVTVNGGEMFRLQAVEQFRLWTGREMPEIFKRKESVYD